jgi:thioester reductase-like protein
VLLTGVTGFLGTALAEKVLRSLPGIRRLYVLVRPSQNRAADERFEKEVSNSAGFWELRRQLGQGFEGFVAKKVRVLEGDVRRPALGLGAAELKELSREVDVVIHCAAEAVFDAPLDEALATNVWGTLALLRLARGWEKKPLFLYVSTAFASGTTKGRIPEQVPADVTPNGAKLDPYEELSRLEQAVEEVGRTSRGARLAARFEATARRELPRISASDAGEVAAAAELTRRAWVREHLVRRAMARARKLGWHDVYTFTKALAERMVLKERGGLPLVIVRPAICVSSFKEPYPGWMKGFRMADPIINGIARGILRDFPGDPEGVIDFVPVDHVANAVLAAGTCRPVDPEVFHVGYGEQNPLLLKNLYGHIRDYFLKNPLTDSNGRPIPVPQWSWPGAKAIERRLRLARVGLGAASLLVSGLPKKGRALKDLRRKISRAQKLLRRNLHYSRLYGPYLENLASTFATDRTQALYEALSPEDQDNFPFAVAGLDWRAWLHETHLPTLAGRRSTKKHKETNARTEERSPAHAS